MYAIDTALEQAISARGSTHVTTTLYELLAALQTAGKPGEDALIVALVTSWARTGRITFMHSETPERQNMDGGVFTEPQRPARVQS